MRRISKVIGPPGTGKTTKLLEFVDKAVKKYGSDAVGAVSYTKTAIQTIVNRVRDAGHAVPRNVQTIHAHCYKLLGVEKTQICDPKKANFKDFIKAYPTWRFTNIESNDPTDYHSPSEGDSLWYFNRAQALRHMTAPIELWGTQEQAIHKDWMNFLTENDLYDYTGMLEKALDKELRPYGMSVMFVDEAQDLTLLQYKLIRMWIEDVQATVFLGDSDQSIFRFTGVTPDTFINIQPTWMILDQSYRVPKNIQDYSQQIIKRVSRREEAPYKPATGNGDGRIIRCGDPDFSLPGTHMIIARTNRDAVRWIKYLNEKNLIWHNPYKPDNKVWNPTTCPAWRAYGVYQKLRNQQRITGMELQSLTSELTAKETMKHGLKTEISKWDEYQQMRLYSFLDLAQMGFATAFLRGNIEPRIFLGNNASYIKNIEKLYTPEEPRICVGTFHSVKGGEMDHVWVDSTLSKFMSLLIDKDRMVYDDEARLAYVAVTRARQTVGIIEPQNPRYKNPHF